ASEPRAFLAGLDGDPRRLEQLEERLERIADLRRRFRAGSFDELLARAAEARAELDALERGADPVVAAEQAVAAAQRRVDELTDALRRARAEAAPRFADAVASELRDLALGSGEFACELGG